MRRNLILLFIFLVSNLIINGQDIRERLFNGADKVKKEAINARAELLSPGYFKDAMDYYTDADKSLQDGDDLEDIRTTIGKSILYFNRSIESANIAVEKFKNTLTARADAEKVNAVELAVKSWNAAEKKLFSAAVEIEKNDMTDAEEYSFEAEKFFRQSELEAIKIQYLDSTWQVIKDAKEFGAEKFAPILLAYAVQQVDYAEKELEENRYNNSYAKTLNSDALSEAKHSINITEILKQFDDEDKTREELILYYEKPLSEIAQKLEIDPRFNNGYEKLKNEIISEINKYYKLKTEYADLQAELEQYKSKMREAEGMKAQLDEIQKFEETYQDVKNMFSLSEAIVLREDNKIILRLTAINFAPGSSVLDPKDFGTLTKVQNAIKKFPGSNLVVEGHTDSDGKSDKNLELSQKRADAVFHYLFANLNIDREKIYAVGYGDNRPIASNKTDAGKVKNRRIDVIIKP